MKTLLRSPLVRFVVIGAVIFVVELLNAHADTRLLEIQTGPEPHLMIVTELTIPPPQENP